MKKLFVFLSLFLVIPVFGITNPQGEILTATIQRTLSDSAVIQITATNIFRAASPLVRPVPELTYFKVSTPTIITRVPLSPLTCGGTLCSNTESRTITGLVCDTEYQGRLFVRSTNSSNPGVNLEEVIPTFKTQPCAQLTTTIKQTNSSKTSISATLEVDTQGTIAGRTDFYFLLSATKEGESPINSTEVRTNVMIAISGASRTATGDVVVNGLECETEYSIVGTSKTNGRNNTASTAQTIETSACDPATSGGTTPTPTGENNEYIFLTPLPLGDNLDTVPSVIIGATGDSGGGILGILQRIFTIMLVAAIVLAVVYMIIGGARYATGDMASAKLGGKEIITNAIKGLLFALLAWLLLNIVNPDLLRFTLSIPNIGQKLTQGTGTGPGGGGGESPCGADVTNEECFDLITADEDSKRQALSAEDIEINKEPCPSYGASNCTNVGLLNDSTLAKIIEIKNDCVSANSNSNCTVMITGGTEYWKHEEGGSHHEFTAVDLRLTGADIFNQFIRSKQSAGPSDYCNARFDYKGLRFCDEKGGDAHWHVAPPTSGGGGTTSGDLIKFENIGKNDLGVWGKASGRPIQPSAVNDLVRAARNASWYSEIQTLPAANRKILAAIIMVESSGDPNKVRTEPDGRKSCGLGQLLTDTAKGLDPTLRNKSVEEICTALKVPNYNIRLSNQHYNSLSGNDFKTRVAAYNGGVGNQGATGDSLDCDGLMRFECPWDEIGCYDSDKPNDEPEDTTCAVNVGYEVTRFYVDKVKKISDRL